MKMAKASEQERQALIDWFNLMEEEGKIDLPQWRRVVFGYGVLVENCCDPNDDCLAFKPGLISFPMRTEVRKD